MTPEQFQEKLKASIPEMAIVINSAPFAVILDVEGQLKSRIFNRGKDSNEEKIGDYDDTHKQTFLTGKAKPSLTKKQTKQLAKTGEKLTYKELRQLKGLEVEYVNLEFTGDLRNSIVTGKEEDKAIVNFNNQNELKIANYLTTKYKKPIFTPSEKEVENAKQLMLNYIREGTKEIIKQWR